MLQNIRKNIQGTMAKVIVGIIVIPFAFFGIESLIGGSGVQEVAKVNGEPITAQELQQQINQQKRRMLMSMGDNIDPTMLDDQMLAGPALEMMIQKSLLLQAATGYGLAVSEQQIGKVIAGMEVFQTAGRFDPQLYRRVLSDQGYTPGGFKRTLQEDLVMTQLRAGLASSEFVTAAEVDAMAVVSEEQRDLRYMVIPLENYRDPSRVDEQSIMDWYTSHEEQFMTEEAVEIDYVELTQEDFLEPLSEEELREAYELEKDTFVQAEQRAVSHILFEPGADESDEQVLARIAVVQALLSTGERSFADLAREYSQDVGSAELGGELGFTSGDSFPEEIEEVVAVLPLDGVSEAVSSDAGWHLFKVTEIRDGGVENFAGVRMQLQERIAGERAQRELIKVVEKLRDRAFNAEDLDGPAADLALEVEQAGPLTRSEPEGLFTNPQVVAAAFSNEVVEEGYNSEVIELADNHFVVLRVSRHIAPELRDLAAVRAEVATRVADENARAEIEQQASDLLLRLREGATVETLALENGYDWQVELGARRDSRNVPGSLLRRAFKLPAGEEGTSTFEYVLNPDGDVELFELVRVMEGDAAQLPETRRVALQQNMMSELSRGTDNRFQKLLRDNADVTKI